MKFAHLADTHLGYRQFGLIEREKDFYEVFEKVIDKIIEEKVDFVIHSGDLFETARPSPIALLTFQKGLLKLKGAGIPMYAIAGNHDIVMRNDSIPPQVIFKKLGLKVISPINTTYMHGDIFIAGLPFYPSSQVKNLKSKLADLSKKAAKHEKSILVLHQGIDKYFGQNYELEIGDLPDNFNYYALGHIHNYINDNFGNGKLVYPGSSEIWKTNELKDYKENGKEKSYEFVTGALNIPQDKPADHVLYRHENDENIYVGEFKNGSFIKRDARPGTYYYKITDDLNINDSSLLNKTCEVSEGSYQIKDIPYDETVRVEELEAPKGYFIDEAVYSIDADLDYSSLVFRNYRVNRFDIYGNKKQKHIIPKTCIGN